MEMPIRSKPAAPSAHKLPDTPEQHKRLREAAREVRILDPGLIDAYIRERQERGIDGPDEIWEGVYTVPALANNEHQDIVTFLMGILFNAVTLEGRGRVQSGANVSDRREGWEHKCRVPDVVVVLKNGEAVDCGTHWMGGPDFLVEVQSPRDESEEKIPFYSELAVRELLIIHRDTRELRLYRHDGSELAPVGLTDFQGGKWLVSEVVPLAFRRKGGKKNPRTEVRCTEGQTGNWTV
jgi:Uma2 family endonuclease